MSNLHHVHGAQQQPPTKQFNGRGERKALKAQEIDRAELKQVLDNIATELSNAIANFRDSHGGVRLSGVACSADLGARYCLDCVEYLQRKY